MPPEKPATERRIKIHSVAMKTLDKNKQADANEREWKCLW